MFCADTITPRVSTHPPPEPLISLGNLQSENRYITSELQNCVVYGLLRWERANASAALVKGPSRCQNGSLGTLLGVGIGSSFRAAVLGSLFVDCARRCRICRRTSTWRRRKVRYTALTAMSILALASPCCCSFVLFPFQSLVSCSFREG